jgi:hypothetical protein
MLVKAPQFTNSPPNSNPNAYYSVRMKNNFSFAGVDFISGRGDYRVPSSVYNATLPDGSKFSDHCSSVVPLSGGF